MTKGITENFSVIPASMQDSNNQLQQRQQQQQQTQQTEGDASDASMRAEFKRDAGELGDAAEPGSKKQASQASIDTTAQALAMAARLTSMPAVDHAQATGPDGGGQYG